MSEAVSRGEAIVRAVVNNGIDTVYGLPDQLATLQTLLKWAARIDSPTAAPELVNQAFTHMMSGRRGPVSLEMCWDVMASRENVDFLDPAHLSPPPEPDMEAVQDAVKILNGAKNILILVGGGAQHAEREVRELAEVLGAGVTAFRAGKGVVSEDHELGLSCAAADDLWADTDVLIGIGTRMELTHMRWTGMQNLIERPSAPPHIIRIDIDEKEMDRFVPHVAIVADAATGAGALAAAASKVCSPAPDSTERIAAAKVKSRREIEKVQPHLAYLDIIRAVLPRDGFLVEELCQAGFVSNFGFCQARREFWRCGAPRNQPAKAKAHFAASHR